MIFDKVLGPEIIVALVSRVVGEFGKVVLKLFPLILGIALVDLLLEQVLFIEKEDGQRVCEPLVTPHLAK